MAKIIAGRFDTQVQADSALGFGHAPTVQAAFDGIVKIVGREVSAARVDELELGRDQPSGWNFAGRCVGGQEEIEDARRALRFLEMVEGKGIELVPPDLAGGVEGAGEIDHAH